MTYAYKKALKIAEETLRNRRGFKYKAGVVKAAARNASKQINQEGVIKAIVETFASYQVRV